MKTYTIKVEQESVITLPDEVIEHFDLHPGDQVHFKELENGCIEMTFPKKESIDIELSDADIFSLMKIAHEQDITLNQLVENILRKEMNKDVKKNISVKELENGDVFDEVVKDVEFGMTYTIYEDKEYTKPLAVLLPIDKLC